MALSGLFAAFGARADAFADRAAEGQVLGAAARQAYTPATADPDTGAITLQNGLAAGRTIPRDQLFQEIRPGSLDAAVNAYGDNTAMSNATASATAALVTGTDQYSKAYQTLQGARTSGASLYNDPIWQASDQTLSGANGLLEGNFTGCDTTTTTELTDALVRIPEYRYCAKWAKPQKCTVTRNVTILPPPVTEASAPLGSAPNTGLPTYDVTGTTTVIDCGGKCQQIQMSFPETADEHAGECHALRFGMTVNVSDADRIVRARVVTASGDDDVELWVDGARVFQARGDGCLDVDEWGPTDFDAGFTSALKKTGNVSLQLVVIAAAPTNRPNGSVTVQIGETSPVVEDFSDSPAGCRANLLAHWDQVTANDPPPWVPGSSPEDKASTPYWQCLDADDERLFSGVHVTPERFGSLMAPILPGAPETPPAPVCYQAETRIADSGSLPCWTDVHGNQQCPGPFALPETMDDCDVFAANPACAYLGETCAEGAIDPATGGCHAWQVKYDCGVDQPVLAGASITSSTLCGGALRCLGSECLTQATEKNPDFGKASGMASVLNGMQMDSGCKDNTGECEVFKGTPSKCQFGKVECCEAPKVGISVADYVELGYNSWRLADRTGLLESITETASGAWSGFVQSASTGQYGELAKFVTSNVDSMVSEAGQLFSDNILSNAITAVTDELTKQAAQWVVDTFGTEAAKMVFSMSTTTTAQGTTSVGAAQLGGALGSIASAVAVVAAVYAIVNIVLDIIYACSEEDLQTSINNQLLKECVEVGKPYCKDGLCIEKVQAFCCYKSPLGRILQEEVHNQMPDLSWGTAENPKCDGLSMSDLQRVDWSRVDLSEWTGIMTQANLLPTSANVRDMYSMAGLTTSKTIRSEDSNKTNILQRINKQFGGADIERRREDIRNEIR